MFLNREMEMTEKTGRLLILIAATTWSIDAFGAEWRTNFEVAEQEASENRSTLVVHFYADWCGPCRRMEHSVLSQASVIDALGNGIVAVKINSDRRPDLVKRFGIRSLPTDVFVRPDGSVVAKHTGSPGLQAYIARLNQHRPVTTTAVDDSTALAASNRVQDKAPLIRQASDSVVASTKSGLSARSDHQSDLERTDAHQQNDTRSMAVLTRRANRRIGLHGYSPVALHQSVQWQAGEALVSSEFQGVNYLFRSQAEKQLFEQDAARYVPVMHGFDPVAYHREEVMTVGDVKFCARYRKRFYFFANEANRNEFLRNPTPYANDVQISFLTSIQTADANL
ncbi:MAG: hypothetical protein Fues2KO_22890 [Fuerstiella sp.]